MSIRLCNASAEALASDYADTEHGLLIWIELAPQHPKLSRAI